MKKLNVLVVVDMQNDFLTGSLANYKAEEVKSGVINLINEMSSKATEDEPLFIYSTRDTHFENYLETLEGKKLPVVHCVKDTPGWEIDGEVFNALESSFNNNKHVNFSVINKYTFGSDVLASAISELLTDEISSQRGSKQVTSEMISNSLHITLCGVCTDICVVSNALLLRAKEPDAIISVVRSATAGVTKESEEASLTTMSACQIDLV